MTTADSAREQFIRNLPWRDRLYFRWRDFWCLYRVRALLLRLALGRRQFDYMNRVLKSDDRIPSARMVDIVVRKDAVERRIEADWIKNIAKIVRHIEPKPL